MASSVSSKPPSVKDFQEKPEMSSDDDDEKIFSITMNRTLGATHQGLPVFSSDDPPETLNDAIDIIITQGKNNSDDFVKQVDDLWSSLRELEDKAKTLLKKRKRLRKRIQEIEDIRDAFEKDPDRLYDGMFDKKPPMGKFDIRGLTSSSRISTLLASDAELTDYEPMSSKNSSFMVLKLENQIQSINSQLKMLQDSLAFTEKGLEKVHLANRHSLVSLIKMFRSPDHHSLTAHMEKSQNDMIPYLAGFVVTLLKLTRTNYEIDEPKVGKSYASCIMKRDDALHTFVQIRNDTLMEEFGASDLVCLMAGTCLKMGAKRGLCFTTEKRELMSRDVRADLSAFKAKGIDVIIIFVEDLIDELPSETHAVNEFLDSLIDNIKLFTGE